MREAAVARKAFDLLTSIYKDFDHIAGILSLNAGGELCMPNCGHCCQQTILITDIAAQYIVQNIKTLPAGRQAVIRDRLGRWLVFQVPGVRPKYQRDNDHNLSEAKARSQEYDLVSRVYCPFLDESKRCLIYPWRDVICRAWGVTRPATASICPRPLLDGERDNARGYITQDDPTVQDALMKLSMVRGLLEDHIPDALNRGWLPYMVFRTLDPEAWSKIENQVQEAKKTKYTGKVNWLVTKEDADLLCAPEPDFLAKTVKF